MIMQDLTKHKYGTDSHNGSSDVNCKMIVVNSSCTQLRCHELCTGLSTDLAETLATAPHVDLKACNAAAGADCDHAQQAQSLSMLLLCIFADSLQCQDGPGDASCEGCGHAEVARG